jgi:hypothetical protein
MAIRLLQEGVTGGFRRVIDQTEDLLGLVDGELGIA